MCVADPTALRPLLRSLLQKAVRRGAVDTVHASAAWLAHQGDSAWLRARVGVIGFEECWPHMRTPAAGDQALAFLVQLARSTKNKEAAGLGSLAHAYSEGDPSALAQAPDPVAVKIVAAAMRRPADFFKWATQRCASAKQAGVVQSAVAFMPRASWPWDKAFMAAGAYLATLADLPAPDAAPDTPGPALPLWVAVDKHTPQGRAGLARVARQLGLPPKQLGWASFYEESALCNALVPGPWWQAERTWRLAQVGLDCEQAQALWRQAAPAFAESVRPAADSLALALASSTSFAP